MEYRYTGLEDKICESNGKDDPGKSTGRGYRTDA